MNPLDIAKTRSSPIGVFDSGLGGLTVMRALSARLPDEQLIYLGDTARVPYGTKSADTVARYAKQIADFLVGRGVKYLVIACNTASAHALGPLQQELQIPVLGVIEPGAEAAVRAAVRARVGVLGTLGTIHSGAYQQALQRIDEKLLVFSHACPLLVPLAEEGWTEHPVTDQIVRHYLLELQSIAGDLDVLVLGCTHYPLLRRSIAACAEDIFGHSLHLVDSAQATAAAAAIDLAKRQLLTDTRAGPDQFYFTDVNRFSEMASRFLGRSVAQAEYADLR